MTGSSGAWVEQVFALATCAFTQHLSPIGHLAYGQLSWIIKALGLSSEPPNLLKTHRPEAACHEILMTNLKSAKFNR